jgi:hypothetical protein
MRAWRRLWRRGQDTADVYSAQQSPTMYEGSKFFSVNLYLANTRLITPLRAFCRHKGAVGVKQSHTTAAGWDKSWDNSSKGPSNLITDEVVSFSRFTLIVEIYLSVRLSFSCWPVGNRIQRICTEIRYICQSLSIDWPFNLWAFWCQGSYCTFAVGGI